MRFEHPQSRMQLSGFLEVLAGHVEFRTSKDPVGENRSLPGGFFRYDMERAGTLGV